MAIICNMHGCAGVSGALVTRNSRRHLKSAGGKSSLCCNATTESSFDSITRRAFTLSWAGTMVSLIPQQPSLATGKSAIRRKVPIDQYTVSDVNGLRYFDLLDGKGAPVQLGNEVVVHWDVLYRGIDVSSSRMARTLGGNRTIAEPFDFVVGESVATPTVKLNDSAGGLFAGGGLPKPPPALSTAVIGMKPGGIRSIIVDVPELGYNGKRMQEIPANDPFELRVELLEISAQRS